VTIEITGSAEEINAIIDRIRGANDLQVHVDTVAQEAIKSCVNNFDSNPYVM
jgi:hypothetical protein